MKSFYNYWKQTLNSLEAKKQRRFLSKAEVISPVHIRINGKSYLNFASNNYLGLTHHPDVIEASVEALRKFGLGSGASRLVTGNFALYEELEKAIARFKEYPKALVFSTGYTTSLALASSLIPKEGVILCDRLIHASLIDGMLLRGGKFLRFNHNDPEHLEKCLKKVEGNPYKLVITEGVFSMDGDIPPLADMYELVKKYEAVLMIDDAHATGVIGERGKGSLSFLGLRDSKRIICMGTLSKALGGLGGFVCADPDVVEFLINKARSFIFTTALPPAVVAGVLKAIEILERSSELVKKLQDNIKFFQSLCKENGVKVHDFPTAIFPIIVGEEEKALELSKFLKSKGFFVPAIRPPAVSPGTSRLRITLSAVHSREDIVSLFNTLLEGLKWVRYFS